MGFDHKLLIHQAADRKPVAVEFIASDNSIFIEVKSSVPGNW